MRTFNYLLRGGLRGQIEKLKGRIQINNNQTQSTNKSNGIILSRKSQTDLCSVGICLIL